MTNENLIADIRNKLGPVATLISLVEETLDANIDIEHRVFTARKVEEILPKARKSIEYVKNFKIVKK